MIDVKLLLRENVAGLGRRGDIVEVSPGYARNFLEPRGLAIKATAGGAAQAEAMRRSQSIKDAKDRESAEEIAKVLVSRTINVKAGPRELSFPAAQYYYGFAVPNFYFHMSTCYNILRANGVEIGKTDFLGA